MKRFWSMFYSVVLLVLLIAGEVAVVCLFAWRTGTAALVLSAVGFGVSVVLAPTVHELGHIVFAKTQGMRLKTTKFSFFRFSEKEGKLRFSFASPFAEEETQTIPLYGGNMTKRALRYVAGGLIFGGGYWIVTLSGAVLFSALSKNAAFFFWGGLPYAVYLFLLNLPPLTYASGKTDGRVFYGIGKGLAAETAMVNAMEIYGLLSEGKSFAEISEKRYSDFPQLAEDEPMYAMILDLRYRFYIESEEFEKAADALNRLAAAAEYLPLGVFEAVAAELVYMHSLNGDKTRAEESGKLCKEYLAQNVVSAKRILAAYSAMCGKSEEAAILKSQAEACLQTEKIAGVRKFEQILLSRVAK